MTVQDLLRRFQDGKIDRLFGHLCKLELETGKSAGRGGREFNRARRGLKAVG